MRDYVSCGRASADGGSEKPGCRQPGNRKKGLVSYPTEPDTEVLDLFPGGEEGAVL